MTRLIAVSNRVPKPGDRYASGGLSVAVRDALEKNGGIWLGWSGEVREGADLEPTPATTRWNNVDYVTVDLTKRDADEYYNGFANRTLWPLFHYRVDLTEFERDFSSEGAGLFQVHRSGDVGDAGDGFRRADLSDNPSDVGHAQVQGLHGLHGGPLQW